jgi:hypothetical protein
MVVFMKATGTKIICMGLVCISGQMVVNMKETMLMIKKTATASTHIQMAGATKASGKMANNMEREYLSVQKEFLEKVNGRTVRECTGWMKFLSTHREEINMQLLCDL